LAAVPFDDPLLIARIDLMRDNEGKWVLTELELVEPSLFFRHNHNTGRMLADEVIRSLNGEVKKKPANLSYVPHKSNKWGFWAMKFFLYVVSFPLMCSLAYRIYWRHGHFFEDEHLFLLT